MARGEIIRKLFQSFSRNEREGFYAAAMELIQEERSKNHILLAKDLERILQNGNAKSLPASSSLYKSYPDVPKDRETGLSLIDIRQFDLNWDDVVLNQHNLDILQRVTLENRKQEILAAYGLQPKSKLLFCGPPGCGKTLTAKVLSGVLGIPLVYANLTAIFSSYLGETATNLKKIFDYIEKGEWVVLFDEFDAIARDRNTLNEHGEVKRLVNSLLQLIDQSNSNSLFIAATNHESLLDKAVWRRFDELLFFGKPDLELRTALLKRYLTRIRYSEVNLENFAADLEEATGADIERICVDAIKTVILRGDRELNHIDLKTAVAHYLDRNRIISSSEKSKRGR
ncbi:AAA family ATPase [Limnofasciculus baicalensis]|uniref:ATP-binding protein n=1 Tax=Limnofasciculus baicalensis BBK-W-15 TaxID=2699891 RepID=A0AAE3GUK0_9CYAN|nr:ATP-binding protein [Limnofasciculus baicalensis]MCP2730332.1 ATP-binding protein [Limnofasciculus baicalensis BBK-W-15]